MASAANGALLTPYVPGLRTFCFALFGASLIPAFLVLANLWGRLVTQPPTPARLVPTLWIVLGPLGQSITAMNLLEPRSATIYGLPWWSFTFPLGTVVTGTTGLAARTGSSVLTAAAVLLFALLGAAWVTVSVLTYRYARGGREHQPVAVDHLAAERHQ